MNSCWLAACCSGRPAKSFWARRSPCCSAAAKMGELLSEYPVIAANADGQNGTEPCMAWVGCSRRPTNSLRQDKTAGTVCPAPRSPRTKCQ